MQITAKNLSYTYSENSKALSVKALDNVSLVIDEGSFFGVIGKTGSGKSTFIQHLNGLIKVGKNKGELTIGEYNLADKNCDFKSLRTKIGMVFQYPEHQLFAETVALDVAFGLKNFEPNLTESQIAERVAIALDTVGLSYEEYADRSPFELSGGQKRRVAIAGVIVTRPEILVLDEPIAGLDPKGKKELTDILKKMHADFVKTVIIVSHDMNFVAENCDKVAVFCDGKMKKSGTPKQIFSDEELLVSAGLELPITAYLTKKYREQGVEIDNDFTVTSFVDAVAKLKGVSL